MLKRKLSPSSPSPPPSNVVRHFFKVYLPSISSQRLKIPSTFINNSIGALHEKPFLKDSLGELWQVEVQKVAEDFFFCNGWQEFVEKHSLVLGEFLVFKYDGNSLFEVKIFGHSGCERGETRAIWSTDKSHDLMKEQEDKEARKSSTHGCTQPRKLDMGNVEQVIDSKASSPGPKPYFKLHISPKTPYNVNIPKQFLIDNNIKLRPKMFIHDANGKTWPVKIITRSDGRHVFGAGWRDFCRNYNIMGEDECTFEFPRASGKGRHVINVYISHKIPAPCVLLPPI